MENSGPGYLAGISFLSKYKICTNFSQENVSKYAIQKPDLLIKLLDRFFLSLFSHKKVYVANIEIRVLIEKGAIY
jgi:hypothetical protein